MKVYTIEGNTSGGSTLVANGGCVASKSYDTTYSRIAKIWRPKYKVGEAKKVVAVAKKYIGYLEKKTASQLQSFSANAGSNNYTIFAKTYKEETGINVQGQPWCDCFVDVVFIEALGVKRAKELLGGFSAYTPTSSANLSKCAKSVTARNAQLGDIIFFKNSERICHTGIIRCDSDTAKKQENSVSSSYSKSDFIKDVCKILNTGSAESAFKKTPTISRSKNSKHALVLPIQKYLKALGYYKGVCDKDFGPQSEQAVSNFQVKVLKYSKGDGIITKKEKTWKKLLGI